MTLKLLVSWHLSMTGKQAPDDPRKRKAYLKEWRRQKRAILRRNTP